MVTISSNFLFDPIPVYVAICISLSSRTPASLTLDHGILSPPVTELGSLFSGITPGSGLLPWCQVYWSPAFYLRLSLHSEFVISEITCILVLRFHLVLCLLRFYFPFCPCLSPYPCLGSFTIDHFRFSAKWLHQLTALGAKCDGFCWPVFSARLESFSIFLLEGVSDPPVVFICFPLVISHVHWPPGLCLCKVPFSGVFPHFPVG